jgi:hypothetical protein
MNGFEILEWKNNFNEYFNAVYIDIKEIKISLTF